MEISTIVKVLGFMLLVGLFFAYSVNTQIFSNMQKYITSLNIELFTSMDARLVFLIVLLIFFLVLLFIFSFLK